MTVYIYPYNIASASCRELADKLNELGRRTLRLKPDSTPRATNRLVITWGNGQSPIWNGYLLNSPKLNTPLAINRASNKRVCLDYLEANDVPRVEHTTHFGRAAEWADEGDTVVVRTSLRGHSGDGIYLAPDREALNEIIDLRRGNVKLLTRYFKKKREYRVHVFRGQVLDVQEKRKRNDVAREDANFQVRSHDNGWVFCRENVTDSERLREIAVQAVNSIPELDFGAVDIGYNEHYDQYRVFEINTACGLEGTTLDRYADAIIRYLNTL